MNRANDAVLAEGRRVLISDPGRFDGVPVIGQAIQTGPHWHPSTPGPWSGDLQAPRALGALPLPCSGWTTRMGEVGIATGG